MDDFGTDLILEFYRVASNFGEGWVYYSFTNPATGRAEPKASYFKSIEWNGVFRCDRGGDLSARPAQQLPERRGQCRHA